MPVDDLARVDRSPRARLTRRTPVIQEVDNLLEAIASLSRVLMPRQCSATASEGWNPVFDALGAV